MSEELTNVAEIVRALNNIHAELKTLNQTLAKNGANAPTGRAPAGRSSDSRSSEYGEKSYGEKSTYTRTGAAGRIHGKNARSNRLEKGPSKSAFPAKPGSQKPSKGIGGYPKKPK